MAAYAPTKEDYDLLLVPNKQINCRIELLDKQLRVIDDLSGEASSCSYSIDAESSVRRTMSISLVVTDSTFDIGDEARTWFDKFLRIYVGYARPMGEPAWYLMGTYALSDGQYDWDSVTSMLTLSCIDLCGWLDGTRNGYVRGLVTKIEEGASIRGSLIKLITQEAGLSKYRIDTWQRASASADGANIAEFDVIPYDMEFGIETSVWAKITQIMELYPGWEAFFDTDGTFVFQEIPTLESDDCVLDDEHMHPLIIGEPTLIPYTEIYNVADLYGACIDADTGLSSGTVDGNVMTFMPDDKEIAKVFDPTDIALNMKIQVKPPADSVAEQIVAFMVETEEGEQKKSAEMPVLYEDGSPIEAGVMRKDKLYVLKYRYDRSEEGAKSNERLLFLGEPQVHAVCKEIAFMMTDEQKAYDKDEYEACETITYRYNPDSPYAIQEMWSEENKNDIRQPLSGGEFENIYSSELAQQRAEYEVWKSTRLQEQTEFTMITVPFLDVNQKIEFTSLRTGVKKQYITKSISGDLMSGIMSVNAIKFYPLYPFIIV